MSAEPLTSLSGSCHAPAVSTVRPQGTVLVLRIVSRYVATVRAAEWDIVAFGTIGSEVTERIVQCMSTMQTEYKVLRS